MNNSKLSQTIKLAFAGALASTLMTGCNDDSNTTTTELPGNVVVATVASDYSAGAHAVFSTTSPYEGSTQQLPTISDVTVACNGDYFYRLERFNADNVTRFAFTAPDAPLYQYSTMESNGTDTQSSNPYDLIFVSDTKAYLLRYGSNTAWIVNPSAASEADFKIGELDLSDYAVDGNSVASMSSAVIADGYLYVTLQRQQSFSPQEAYVAIFDTLTDTEIDVDTTTDGMKGVALSVKNPSDIEYNAETKLIYVNGVGNYFPQEFTGGIATIDPTNNFTASLLLDDGDADTHPYGQISQMEIISSTVGYFAGYAAFQDESLYRFNPSTGIVETDANGAPQAIAEIASTSIGGLAQDSNGRLWVSIADANAPGIKLLNAADGSVEEELLETTLNPTKVSICASSS